MNIVVVGTGYVGLVTGTCFAELGNQVTCVDIDQKKIDGLKQGIMPIYEPGLDEMVERNFAEGRLHFTTSLAEACVTGDIHFIAVGTPPGEDGSADLQYVLDVARELGQHMRDGYNIVVDKSTVPVGTADKVTAVINEELAMRDHQVEFEVVSNPEFLKEGAAIDDFMHPDRVVIGAQSERTIRKMRELYTTITRSHERAVVMGVREAEMTKYAANALLATKISFMNELAGLCEKMDADVEQVRLGIGSDSRIGYHFIYPGCGYGGSCFPKDVKALISMCQEQGIDPLVLDAVEARNERQKQTLFAKITARYGTDLSDRTFALWGLAFKPGTDDMREAPSLVLIDALVKAGAKVRAHDPVAIETASAELPAAWLESGQVQMFVHQYEPLTGADALVLVTEWMPFRSPDFDHIKRELSEPVIFDGRNQYNPQSMAELGFEYRAIGRGNN